MAFEITCHFCGGTGLIDGETCTDCYGDGIISTYIEFIASTVKYINETVLIDIADKIDDINEKVDEIKVVVDAL